MKYIISSSNVQITLDKTLYNIYDMQNYKSDCFKELKNNSSLYFGIVLSESPFFIHIYNYVSLTKLCDYALYHGNIEILNWTFHNSFFNVKINNIYVVMFKGDIHVLKWLKENYKILTNIYSFCQVCFNDDVKVFIWFYQNNEKIKFSKDIVKILIMKKYVKTIKWFKISYFKIKNKYFKGYRKN